MKKIIFLFCFCAGRLYAQSAPLNYDEALKKLDRLLWIIPELEIKEKTESYEEASKKYCKDLKDCVLKKELVYYAEKIIYESPDSKEPYGYLVRYRPKAGYQPDYYSEGITRSVEYGSYLITTSFKEKDTYSDAPVNSVLNNYPIIYETKKEKDLIWARLTDLPSKKSVWLKLPLRNLDGHFFKIDNKFFIFGLYPISSKATSKDLEMSFFDTGSFCFRGQGYISITDVKGNKLDYDPSELAILPLRISNGEVEFVAYKKSGGIKVDLVAKIKKDAIVLKMPLGNIVKMNGLSSCSFRVLEGEQSTWSDQDLLTEKDIANPPNRLESIKSK